MNGRFGQDTDAALRNYQSDHAGGILEFGPDISAMEPEIIPASAVVRPAIPATNQYY